MKLDFQYGHEKIRLEFPEDSIIYQSKYKPVSGPAPELLLGSLENRKVSLNNELKKRRGGDIVIVVSDITRPIPYRTFLPQLTAHIEQNKIERNKIKILVATGMHRPSTKMEQIEMFGNFIVNNYQIINHHCDKEDELEIVGGLSWSGSEIKLNSHYVRSGFRIITGLVEPHFMAGFSGGRKAICPGLVSLDTVKKFHGYEFLSHPNATNGVLDENPCHLENTSIAKTCPPDFAVNVVLDHQKEINAIFSGELFESHRQAVDYVSQACCPKVERQADLALTSGGGYPLDATFYQCVKGIVNCIPAIKNKGEVIAFGSCSEGIGSPEYAALLKKYSGRHMKFLDDISNGGSFIKDQWQFQMQIRALEKTGLQNLHFYTSNIPLLELSMLSVQPYSLTKKEIEESIQKKLNEATRKKLKIAVFPEGPYCSPVS